MNIVDIDLVENTLSNTTLTKKFPYFDGLFLSRVAVPSGEEWFISTSWKFVSTSEIETEIPDSCTLSVSVTNGLYGFTKHYSSSQMVQKCPDTSIIPRIQFISNLQSKFISPNGEFFKISQIPPTGKSASVRIDIEMQFSQDSAIFPISFALLKSLSKPQQQTLMVSTFLSPMLSQLSDRNLRIEQLEKKNNVLSVAYKDLLDDREAMANVQAAKHDNLTAGYASLLNQLKNRIRFLEHQWSDHRSLKNQYNAIVKRLRENQIQNHPSSASSSSSRVPSSSLSQTKGNNSQTSLDFQNPNTSFSSSNSSSLDSPSSISRPKVKRTKKSYNQMT